MLRNSDYHASDGFPRELLHFGGEDGSIVTGGDADVTEPELKVSQRND